IRCVKEVGASARVECGGRDFSKHLVTITGLNADSPETTADEISLFDTLGCAGRRRGYAEKDRRNVFGWTCLAEGSENTCVQQQQRRVTSHAQSAIGVALRKHPRPRRLGKNVRGPSGRERRSSRRGTCGDRDA